MAHGQTRREFLGQVSHTALAIEAESKEAGFLSGRLRGGRAFLFVNSQFWSSGNLSGSLSRRLGSNLRPCSRCQGTRRP